MKLYSLLILYKNAEKDVKILKGAYDLQSFSFFQRNSVREFMVFTAKVIIERSEILSRSSVKEQEYVCHVYVRADKLAGVVVSDAEYPQRVAHNLLTRALDDFSSKVPPVKWPTVAENVDPAPTYKGLDEMLAKYQDPKQSDALTRVQDELDETKIILHETMKAVLERGEKLDDLVEKADALSAGTKMFYTSARKMNKCCTWI